MTSILNFKIRAWFTKQEFQQKMGIFYYCVKSVVLLFIQKHFGIVCSNAFTKKKKQHHGRTVSIQVWLKLEELRIQCSYYQSTSLFTRHHQFYLARGGICNIEIGFFYCKTLSLFILLIHLYYEFYFFYFGFYILQAHEKELEWKQMTLELRWSNEVSTVGSAMLDFCTLVSKLWTELHHTVNVGTSARHQVVVSELRDSVSIEIPLLKHNLLIFCY